MVLRCVLRVGGNGFVINVLRDSSHLPDGGGENISEKMEEIEDFSSGFVHNGGAQGVQTQHPTPMKPDLNPTEGESYENSPAEFSLGGKMPILSLGSNPFTRRRFIGGATAATGFGLLGMRMDVAATPGSIVLQWEYIQVRQGDFEVTVEDKNSAQNAINLYNSGNNFATVNPLQGNNVLAVRHVYDSYSATPNYYNPTWRTWSFSGTLPAPPAPVHVDTDGDGIADTWRISQTLSGRMKLRELRCPHGTFDHATGATLTEIGDAYDNGQDYEPNW